jgi:hypothetical protein
MTQELFYIQDTRTYLGNAVMWWGIDGSGYTCDITQAGKYTREKAEGICQRPSDKAWSCDYIDGNSKAHKTIIDVQYLDKSYSGIKSNSETTEKQ